MRRPRRLQLCTERDCVSPWLFLVRLTVMVRPPPVALARRRRAAADAAPLTLIHMAEKNRLTWYPLDSSVAHHPVKQGFFMFLTIDRQIGPLSSGCAATSSLISTPRPGASPGYMEPSQRVLGETSPPSGRYATCTIQSKLLMAMPDGKPRPSRPATCRSPVNYRLHVIESGASGAILLIAVDFTAMHYAPCAGHQSVARLQAVRVQILNTSPTAQGGGGVFRMSRKPSCNSAADRYCGPEPVISVPCHTQWE